MSLFAAVRTVLLVALTPLLEKNVLRTLALKVPVVFSMRRLIVLAFAVAMFRQIWKAGVAGWPEAMLTIAIVLAFPILGALENVQPADVLEIAKVLLGRFGVGETRRVTSVYGEEPSKFDDHRTD